MENTEAAAARDALKQRGVTDDDDEPIDPTDSDAFDDAEDRLLAKAGIDRSHVWGVSTPW